MLALKFGFSYILQPSGKIQELKELFASHFQKAQTSLRGYMTSQKAIPMFT